MIYITGDCHGNFEQFTTSIFPEQKEMTKDDYVTTEEVHKRIYAEIDLWKKRGNDRVDVLIATPPCQGIECYKERIDGGKKTKISKYCKKHGEIKSIEKELALIVGGLN